MAGEGIHYRLADTLLRQKQAGIGKTIKLVTYDAPYAYSRTDNDSDYEETLRRSGILQDKIRRFHFEPEPMAELMYSLLKPYANLIIMFNTVITDVLTTGDRVKSIIVRNMIDNQEYEVESEYYSDCTGDIVLARKAGCKYAYGEESHDMYHEPSAPLTASKVVNGVTKIFRCKKTGSSRPFKMPMEYINENTRKWMENIQQKKIVSVINEYPNGDLNINLLPTMDGNEFFSLSENDRDYYLVSRTYAYFEFLSSLKDFQNYRISGIFNNTGVRESYRLIGQYVLKEQDVLSSRFTDNILCHADHALDTHGQSNVKGRRAVELEQPYGVPEDCVKTQEMSNLIVACRGASFSHIAASSCRLSRTMIALGEGSAKVLMSMYENKM